MQVGKLNISNTSYWQPKESGIPHISDVEMNVVRLAVCALLDGIRGPQ